MSIVEMYKTAGVDLAADTRCYRCAFPGCHRSTTRHPYLVGWCNLCDWGPGIPDGWYCGPHGDALEALLETGELEHIQSSVKR